MIHMASKDNVSGYPNGQMVKSVRLHNVANRIPSVLLYLHTYSDFVLDRVP